MNDAGYVFEEIRRTQSATNPPAVRLRKGASWPRYGLYLVDGTNGCGAEVSVGGTAVDRSSIRSPLNEK